MYFIIFYFFSTSHKVCQCFFFTLFKLLLDQGDIITEAFHLHKTLPGHRSRSGLGTRRRSDPLSHSSLLYSPLFRLSFFSVFFPCCSRLKSQPRQQTRSFSAHFRPPPPQPSTPHPPPPTPDSPGPMIDCSLSAFVPGNCFVLLTVCLRPGPDSRDIAPPFLRLSAPMCLKPRPSELQWNM